MSISENVNNINLFLQVDIRIRLLYTPFNQRDSWPVRFDHLFVLRSIMSENQFPDQSVIFHPVGTGDSTTIMIDNEHVIQVDLHHMESANEEDSKYTPVVDVLKELLPQRNSHPYL